jgi:hypothetical protein
MCELNIGVLSNLNSTPSSILPLILLLLLPPFYFVNPFPFVHPVDFLLCTENPIYVFPKMKLRSLIPNSY